MYNKAGSLGAGARGLACGVSVHADSTVFESESFITLCFLRRPRFASKEERCLACDIVLVDLAASVDGGKRSSF